MQNLTLRRSYILASALLMALVAVSLNTNDKAGAQTVGPTVLAPNLAVRIVAAGLISPTGLAFIGPNDILAIEKNTGKVQRVTNGTLVGTVLDLPVNFASERGLLGIALHPNFPTTPHVFLFWSESSTGADTNELLDVPLLGNRVDRYVWNGTALSPDGANANLIKLRALQNDATNPMPRGNHDGGVIRFGPDGKLYIIFGDTGRRGQLQNLVNGPFGPGTPDDQFGGPEPDAAHLTGVILRLNPDGTTPTDNPFFAAGATLGETVGPNVQKIFAYGIRNSFGMAFDPESGNLWQQENGDDTFDELNLVEPGMNGGWIQFMGPASRIAQFKEIEVARMGGLQQVRWQPTLIADTPEEATARLFALPGSQYSDPEFSWKFAVAPAAIGFLNSRALGPQFEGDLFVGASVPALAGGYLFHFNLTGNRRMIAVDDPRLEDRVADNTDKFNITESEELLFGRNFGIVTDIQTGPNGNLFVVSLLSGTIYEIYRADSCLQDNSTGDMLRFNSATGDFQFLRCGADGTSVLGRATLIRRGCTLELRSAQVTAVINTCFMSSLGTGDAEIKLTPVGPTFQIRDGSAGNTCSCR
jgi:aldose sugar dehydrogenase